MRTNIILEDSLRELIHQALEEFVKNRRRRNLLDLAGKIEFAEGYDYKSLRAGKKQ